MCKISRHVFNARPVSNYSRVVNHPADSVMTDRSKPRYVTSKAPNMTVTNLVATCENGLTFILTETGIGVVYPREKDARETQRKESWFIVDGDLIYNPVSLKVNRDGTRLLIETQLGCFYANINPYEEYPEQHPLALRKVPVTEESAIATYLDAQFVPGTKHYVVFGYAKSRLEAAKDRQKIVLVNLERWDAYLAELERLGKDDRASEERKEAEKESIREIKLPETDDDLRAIRFAPHATSPLVRLCLFYLTASRQPTEASQGRIHIVMPLLTPDQDNAVNTVDEIVRSASGSGVPEILMKGVMTWKRVIEMNIPVMGTSSRWDLLPADVTVTPNGSFEFLDDYVVFARGSGDRELVMYSLQNVDMWPLLVNGNPQEKASVVSEAKHLTVQIPPGAHFEQFFNQKPLFLQRIGRHRLIGKNQQGLFQIIQAEDGTAKCIGIPLIFSPEHPIMGFGGDLFCIVAPGYHVQLPSYRMCCESIKSGGTRTILRFDPKCSLDSASPWAKTWRNSMEDLLEEIDRKKGEAQKTKRPAPYKRRSDSSRLDEVKRQLTDLLKEDGPVSTLIKEAQERKTAQSKTEELFDQILDDLENVIGLQYLHSVEDFLENLEQFHEFSKADMHAIVQCHKECPNDYRDWVLDVTSRNMRSVDEKSSGWDEAVKQQEISEPNTHYLIAVCDTTPIAFVHFRFEQNGTDVCLFIMDLEVEEKFQKRGVGRFLVDACEAIARKNHVESVVTSTFSGNNVGSMFFEHLGYIPREPSPEIRRPAKEGAFEPRVMYKSVG